MKAARSVLAVVVCGTRDLPPRVICFFHLRERLTITGPPGCLKVCLIQGTAYTMNRPFSYTTGKSRMFGLSITRYSAPYL
jgi:hypothetical protein